MGIRLRKDITDRPWEVRLRLTGRPPVVAYFATRDEAAAFEADARLRVKAGEPAKEDLVEPGPATEAPATLRDVSRTVLRGMRDATVVNRSGDPYRPQSVVAYESFLRRHIIPHVGEKAPEALTSADVVKLRDHLVATESPGVAKNAVIALSVLLRWCLERGHVTANVATRLPPLTARRKDPIRFLSRHEADMLQRAADEAGMGDRVAVALATGIRRGELEGLMWGDIHNEFIKVERQRRRTGELVATKTDRARKVPIGPGLLDRFRAMWEDAGRPAAGELVFSPEPTAVWQQVRAAVPSPAPRWHDLRHTAATHFLAAGVRIHEVAEILGHSSPQLVIRLYGHALPEEVSLAGVVLEAWRAQGTPVGEAVDVPLLG